MSLSVVVVALGAVLAALPACRNDDAPGRPDAEAPRVLVLSDGGSEDHVLDVLGAAGLDAARGGPWYEGAGADLHAYDVVFLLNGYDYSHRMDAAAQARLAQWVADGGGLVVTEWFHYYAARNPELAAILPVTVSNDYAYGADTLHPVAGHELADGLPATLPTGPDWTRFVLEPDTTGGKTPRVALTGGGGGAAVVTGRHGDGRLVCLGMAGVYEGDDVWTAEVDALLCRVARWAGGRIPAAAR